MANTPPVPPTPRTVRLEVEIPEAWVELLQVFVGEEDEDWALCANLEAVIARVLDHVQQGVYRPGSWERAWICQVFGDGWVSKMRVDPKNHLYERPR